MVHQFDDIETLSLLGKVHMVLGQPSKAEYYFNQVIQQQPDVILGIVNLAKLQLLNEQFHRVISSLKGHKKLFEEQLLVFV